MQTVTIGKDNTLSLFFVAEPTIPYNMQPQLDPPYPLKLSYTSETVEEVSQFTLTQTGMALKREKPPTANTSCVQYLSSKSLQSYQVIAEWFGNLDLKGRKADIIEVMRLVDSRIKDMSVIIIGGTSGIYADIDLDTRYQVSMLGEGINRLMLIALAMLANPGSVILIDEIENGFHHSFFPKLWETIGRLVIETNCQVFATTHNHDCMKGAEPLTMDESNPELFRFVRIDHIRGVTDACVFDSDDLQYALNNEWEIM
jgi:hypothetical protein